MSIRLANQNSETAGKEITMKTPKEWLAYAERALPLDPKLTPELVRAIQRDAIDYCQWEEFKTAISEAAELPGSLERVYLCLSNGDIIGFKRTSTDASEWAAGAIANGNSARIQSIVEA